MGYVTAEWYKQTYKGSSIPDDILQGTLDRASMEIDDLTRMRIKKFGGFSQLSEFEQLRVQLAVCSQAEYLHTKLSMNGVSSYNIGDVSVNFEKALETYSKSCLNYLTSTRLMYRGL